MHFGLNVPNFGDFADPETFVRLAREAEASGWEGLFVWDHINPFPDYDVLVSDPWILLAAAAQATATIRLGPMVTPIPRRRPWTLARQTATLDRLSRGRLILGVGLGVPVGTEYEAFGEDGSLKGRAEKLDEGLDVLAGLWSGRPFEYSGRHYRVARTAFLPTPVQQPRIPVWVAGTWPLDGPLARASRWDGYAPLKFVDGEFVPLTPDEIAAARGRVAEARGSIDGFDISLAVEVVDAAPRDRALLRAYADAGLTWWSEALSTRVLPLDAMWDLVRQGPPAL